MESELKTAKEKFHKEGVCLREQVDAVKKEREDVVESFKQDLGGKLKKEMVNHIRALGDILGHFPDPESEGEAAPPKEVEQTPPAPVLPVVASPNSAADSTSSYYSDSDPQGD